MSANVDFGKLLDGMIMSSTGKVEYIDINNTIVTVEPSITINDKKVYGVYSGFENVVDNDNNLFITNYYVNSVGEGSILISNYAGEIQNGDYITSCPISGYGCLQTDDILHSYTVAKCTEVVDWDAIQPTLEYQGQMYKIYLASCTYHCG